MLTACKVDGKIRFFHQMPQMEGFPIVPLNIWSDPGLLICSIFLTDSNQEGLHFN